jgi:regulator of protease activity HflC (stomatin/prohibitin superfamily)
MSCLGSLIGSIFENPLNWLVLGLFAFSLLYLVSRIRIVPAASVAIVERMGKFLTVWSTGLHFLYPFIDRVHEVGDPAGKMGPWINLNERLITYPIINLMMADGISIRLQVTLSLQIVDPKLYVYGSVSPNIILTRMIVNAVKETLQDYDSPAIMPNHAAIRAKIQTAMSEKMLAWGIRLNRVDIGKPYPEQPTYHRI